MGSTPNCFLYETNTLFSLTPDSWLGMNDNEVRQRDVILGLLASVAALSVKQDALVTKVKGQGVLVAKLRERILIITKRNTGLREDRKKVVVLQREMKALEAKLQKTDEENLRLRKVASSMDDPELTGLTLPKLVGEGYWQ